MKASKNLMKVVTKSVQMTTIPKSSKIRDIWKGGARGWGVPYKKGRDALRLAWRCKFRILVSLRVFWAKCNHIAVNVSIRVAREEI